jgi:hypothetical protein
MESSPKAEVEKQGPPEAGEQQDPRPPAAEVSHPVADAPADLEPGPKGDENEDTTEDGVSLGAGFDFADPNSRLAPLYLRASHVVAVFFLALLFLWFSYRPVWYTDIWAHLKFGEYIIEEGRLPTEEMFSGDFAEKTPYINYQWAAQAAEYLVFELGRNLGGGDSDHQLWAGAALLALSLAVVRTLQFLVLILAFRRLTGSLPFALVGAGLALFLSLFASLNIVRPQMFGDLAFALLLLLLSQPVLSWRALILGPLLMVAWANFHGSFAIGLALMGMFWAGRALSLVWPAGGEAASADGKTPSPSWGERLRNWPRALLRDVQTRRLTLLLAASLAGVAVLNPHGPALLLYTWKLANHPNIVTMGEWMPLPLQSPGGMAFVASVLLLVPILYWSPKRVTPTQILLVVVFGVQTLLHLRFLNWWAMVYPWVVVPHGEAIYRRYGRSVGEEAPPDLRKTILAAILALVVISWSQPGQWLLAGLLGREEPLGPECLDRHTPVAVAKYMKEHPPIAPIFASETLGDYLVWDLPVNPRQPTVFCYTHLHLFTTRHWQECETVENAEKGWQRILDRHGVRYLAVEMSRFGKLIDEVEADKEGWKVIRLKDTGIFFAQRRLPGENAGR